MTRKTIKHDHISYYRNHEGYLILSGYYNGKHYKQWYIYYTKKEATALFRLLIANDAGRKQ